MLTTLLLDQRTSPPSPVVAEIDADFPDSRFLDVEASWATERRQLVSAEHGHWDWMRKLGHPDYRYVAVRLGTSVGG